MVKKEKMVKTPEQQNLEKSYFYKGNNLICSLYYNPNLKKGGIF
jgi:hypothetical protein